MIVGIRAFQDLGKSALMVGKTKELVLWHGYGLHEVISNMPLTWPGSTILNQVQFRMLIADPDWNPTGGPLILISTQMRSFVHAMVHKGIQHKIILLDEADRLFPSRFWHDPAQSEALIGLWQDFKLFNYIFWTGHEGTSVDIILKSVTQVELQPLGYDEYSDSIDYIVFNAVKGQVFTETALDVSKNIFPDYDRWSRIGVELFDRENKPALKTIKAIAGGQGHKTELDGSSEGGYPLA